MPIYTKKGDKGQTKLFNKKLMPSESLSKNSLDVNALGNIDELNSTLGFAASLIKIKEIKNLVLRSQRNLLTLGSVIAGSDLKIKASEVKFMEKTIDEIDTQIPKIANFIIPGGSEASGALQMCRSICRRAERSIVALDESRKIGKNVLKYINRLSDFIFTLARYHNFLVGEKEEVWLGKTQNKSS